MDVDLQDIVHSTVQSAEQHALVEQLSESWGLNRGRMQSRGMPVLQDLREMLAGGVLIPDQGKLREAMIAYMLAATESSEPGLRKLPSETLKGLFIKTISAHDNELAQDLLTSE